MRRDSGFTLIELLIVVAIIGIIAAIAIPNLLHALQRGKQKRTMADMRTVATACSTYLTDAGFYPRGITDISALASHIEPVYLQSMPHLDGWHTELGTTTEADGSHFTLVSYGKNRVVDGFLGVGTITQEFNADIWIADSSFVQYPEGLQTGQ